MQLMELHFVWAQFFEGVCNVCGDILRGRGDGCLILILMNVSFFGSCKSLCVHVSYGVNHGGPYRTSFCLYTS